MAKRSAQTVEAYLNDLSQERQSSLREMRSLILKNLPKGYEEAMNWGMICYEVPLHIYPDTYNNKPLSYLSLAAQKNNNALYMMGLYSDPQKQVFLKKAALDQGKRMDMGKSCIRFNTPEELPLHAIAELIRAYTPEEYVALHKASRSKKP